MVGLLVVQGPGARPPPTAQRSAIGAWGKSPAAHNLAPHITLAAAIPAAHPQGRHAGAAGHGDARARRPNGHVQRRTVSCRGLWRKRSTHLAGSLCPPTFLRHAGSSVARKKALTRGLRAAMRMQILRAQLLRQRSLFGRYQGGGAVCRHSVHPPASTPQRVGHRLCLVRGLPAALPSGCGYPLL